MKNTKVKDINSTIFYQLSAPCFYPHMWMNSASSQRTVVLRAIALQLAHFHDKAIVKIKHTRSFSLTNYTLELCTVFETKLYHFLLALQFLFGPAIGLQRLPPFLEIFEEDRAEFFRLRIRKRQALLDVFIHLVADLIIAFVLILILRKQAEGAKQKKSNI